jgi:hypothetical protein
MKTVKHVSNLEAEITRTLTKKTKSKSIFPRFSSATNIKKLNKNASEKFPKDMLIRESNKNEIINIPYFSLR